MEQDKVLRLLFDCAVSAAVPQASICSSSDSAVFVPVLLRVISLSLFKSYSLLFFVRRGCLCLFLQTSGFF